MNKFMEAIANIYRISREAKLEEPLQITIKFSNHRDLARFTGELKRVFKKENLTPTQREVINNSPITIVTVMGVKVLFELC